MTPKQRNRLITFIALGLGLGVAAILVLIALSQNINLFYTPEDVLLDKAQVGQSMRMGGMVVPGSVSRGAQLSVDFEITDFKHNVQVHYQGILPDLFKENQGVVVQGVLMQNNQFRADQVLAKHDEKYMPPQVAKKVQT